MSQIIPLLSVRRGAEALAFYKEAFGADEILVLRDEGATFAMLTIGGAEFWISDESPEHGNFSPETIGGSTTRIILVVDDPQGVWNQAVALGAAAVSDVEENHGWLSGRIQDPFGHHWEISKRL